jgi:hypothetical protein
MGDHRVLKPSSIIVLGSFCAFKKSAKKNLFKESETQKVGSYRIDKPLLNLIKNQNGIIHCPSEFLPS